MEKSLLMEKSKSEESPVKKIAKEERKSIILSRKEKKSLVKATGTGGAPRWCPDFEQRSRRKT